MKDISKTKQVRGIGTVMYKFTATNGDLLYLPGLAYHLDIADIRHFGPQTYHQLYRGENKLDGERVIMHLQQQSDFKIRHNIKISIKKAGSNLPLTAHVLCADSEKHKFGHTF